MANFEIRFLDHAALKVRDLEVSTKWYMDVLGLKKYTSEEWGEYPVFLLAGKSGLALFPATEPKHTERPAIRVDHLAFNVTNENYDMAKKDLAKRGIDFKEQDHHHFLSIYFSDPDGHQLELTTIVNDDESFYNTPDTV